MAYATVADLLERYDVRAVCEFASDDPAGIPISVGNLATTGTVIAAFDDASSMIDAACQYGKRYLRADLVALVANADRQKGSLIRRVTCDLVMMVLVSRRLAPGKDVDALIPMLKASQEWLARLHNGDMVLDIDTALNATLPTGVTGPVANDPNRMTNINPMFGVLNIRRC